jgi:hypothetical protein
MEEKAEDKKNSRRRGRWRGDGIGRESIRKE